ncbi:unnamed protein product (mitochondrion) [Plasmodiophora brassicae]|uniref:Cyclic nucleotide-binding domain-containing protein n=1 Tax=Plasmodiophora brassicae TaxID=37360 RepID=A0A0G4IQG9_PLABS|nr:hypothetical protein PBRA_000812 [Plasmodiophora brassicae]SPQ97779.1 unnamed protein product [Plasmodiophora brassicae]
MVLAQLFPVPGGRSGSKPPPRQPFFMRHWAVLRNLKTNVERDEILREAWDEFVSDGKTVLEFDDLETMVRSFLMSIPAVQHLAGKIPDTLIHNTVSRHTQTMLVRLVGDESQRMEVRMTREDLQAVFCYMFVIPDWERERANVDTESTLHGLEELDKSLEPFSNMSITGSQAESMENVLIGILSRTQRLFQELEFLIDIVKESFLKYNFARSQLRAIFTHLKLRVVNAGDYLCQEGDAGDEFYVLFHGLIGVRKKVMSSNNVAHESEISEIPSGTAFGELSLMQRGGIRHAALIAKRDCVLGLLERSDFRAFMYPYVRKVQHDKLHFFERLPYLVGMDPKAIFDISYEARIRMIKPRTIIYQQHQTYPNVILFIKSGHVRVIRELMLKGDVCHSQALTERSALQSNRTSRSQSKRSTNVSDSRASNLNEATGKQWRNIELPSLDKLLERSQPILTPPRRPRRASVLHRRSSSHGRYARVNATPLPTMDMASVRKRYESEVAKLKQKSLTTTQASVASPVVHHTARSNREPVFVDVTVLGQWSAIGCPFIEGKKRGLIPASFIALDHVLVFEVSTFDLQRRLNDRLTRQLYMNLFRCPADDDLKELLKLEDKWRQYRERIGQGRHIDFQSPRVRNPYRRPDLYANNLDK